MPVRAWRLNQNSKVVAWKAKTMCLKDAKMFRKTKGHHRNNAEVKTSVYAIVATS